MCLMLRSSSHSARSPAISVRPFIAQQTWHDDGQGLGALTLRCRERQLQCVGHILGFRRAQLLGNGRFVPGPPLGSCSTPAEAGTACLPAPRARPPAGGASRNGKTSSAGYRAYPGFNRTARCDCPTRRMISSSAGPGYLIPRLPHPRSCFFLSRRSSSRLLDFNLLRRPRLAPQIRHLAGRRRTRHVACQPTHLASRNSFDQHLE